MHIMNSSIMTGGLAIILAACATTNNDPREGGLFTSIYQINRGGYDNWLQERKAEHQSALREQTLLEKEHEHLKEQAVQSQTAMTLLQARLTQMTQETQELAAKIERLKENQGHIQSQKAQLKQKIKQIRAKNAKLTQAVATQRGSVEDYKKQAAQLQLEINDLWEIYHKL